MQHGLIVDDAISKPEEILPDCVYSFTLLRLHTRLRLPGIFHFSPPTHPKFELFAYNAINFPQGTTWPPTASLIPGFGEFSSDPYRAIRTQLIVIQKNRKVEPSYLDAVRQSFANLEANGIPGPAQGYEKSVKYVVEMFISAYALLDKAGRIEVTTSSIMDTWRELYELPPK